MFCKVLYCVFVCALLGCLCVNIWFMFVCFISGPYCDGGLDVSVVEKGEPSNPTHFKHVMFSLSPSLLFFPSTRLHSSFHMPHLLPTTPLNVPVSFPKPLSPLLDIHVIVGDDARLGAMVAGFDRVVSEKSFSPWKSLDWFQNDLWVDDWIRFWFTAYLS